MIGTLISLAMAAMPLGMVLGGFLQEAIGLRPLLAGIAACYLAVTLGMLLNPTLKELDASKQSS